MEQILDRLVTLLISISDLTKLSGQKGVNDRSKKNDGRDKIERLPLNPIREFSENRRNLLVMVAIDRAAENLKQASVTLQPWLQESSDTKTIRDQKEATFYPEISAIPFEA